MIKYANAYVKIQTHTKFIIYIWVHRYSYVGNSVQSTYMRTYGPGVPSISILNIIITPKIIYPRPTYMQFSINQPCRTGRHSVHINIPHTFHATLKVCDSMHDKLILIDIIIVRI